MTPIPQRMPAWLRNTDFVLVRFIAFACFVKMLLPDAVHVAAAVLP